ncbi:MAG: DUF2283 domain-containing protein [Acidobacteriaceae bacterium]|nr:DUF2283 domain-containing protein [Acidobacteriaceae bacterium]MBV9765650.1 DUF2283 domain-containing protein [Acidobacteriaceae bacterium]
MESQTKQATLPPETGYVTVDPTTGYVYFRVTNAAVAYTSEIAAGINADYDEAGFVRGIEAENQEIVKRAGGLHAVLKLARAEKDRTPSGSENDGP